MKILIYKKFQQILLIIIPITTEMENMVLEVNTFVLLGFFPLTKP